MYSLLSLFIIMPVCAGTYVSQSLTPKVSATPGLWSDMQYAASNINLENVAQNIGNGLQTAYTQIANPEEAARKAAAKKELEKSLLGYIPGTEAYNVQQKKIAEEQWKKDHPYWAQIGATPDMFAPSTPQGTSNKVDPYFLRDARKTTSEELKKMGFNDPILEAKIKESDEEIKRLGLTSWIAIIKEVVGIVVEAGMQGFAYLTFITELKNIISKDNSNSIPELKAKRACNQIANTSPNASVREIAKYLLSMQR